MLRSCAPAAVLTEIERVYLWPIGRRSIAFNRPPVYLLRLPYQRAPLQRPFSFFQLLLTTFSFSGCRARVRLVFKRDLSLGGTHFALLPKCAHSLSQHSTHIMTKLWPFGLLATVLILTATRSTAKLIDVTEEAIFDISIGGKPQGTVVIALFGRDTPKTVANFAKLASANGFNGQSYRNSRFHRVIPNFMIQVGDSNDINKWPVKLKCFWWNVPSTSYLSRPLFWPYSIWEYI